MRVPLLRATGPLKCQLLGLGAGLLAQPAERLGQSPYGTLVGVKIFGHFGFAWTFVLPELFLAGVWLSNGLAFGWMIGLWR
jgi:hypothetical protein